MGASLARWWERLHHYAKRLVEITAATWAEATEGRSYAADYMGMDLDELLKNAKVKVLPLGGTARYVVTSDHHRKQDDVTGPESRRVQIAVYRAVYRQALQFYARNGYTLIEAGDIEELWRLGPGVFSWTKAWEKILLTHEPIYQQIRSQFVQTGRYIRLWGNHDAVWRYDRYRWQYLTPVLGATEVYEMALLGNRFLIMHGHAVDRWNNDRRGWWVGRVFSKTPIHLDTVTHVAADPDGTYPNWVGGRHRNDWLARMENSRWGRKLLGDNRFHPIRAVECDFLYVQWARMLGLNLICGHTHEPAMFPRDLTGYETPYINCGSGLGAEELQAIEIDGDGIPIPVKWTNTGRQVLCFRPGTRTECGEGGVYEFL